MIKIIAALLFAGVLARPAHAADYWICVDAAGHRTAQDRPCPEGSAPARAATAPAGTEPRPLLSLPRLDVAELERHKPLLRQGVLALLAFVALVLLWRGVQRLQAWWATREPRPRKPTAPERIEPSEALRRQARNENST